MSSKGYKGSPKGKKVIWDEQTKLKKEIHYENFSEGIEKFYFWVTEFMESTLHYELEKMAHTIFLH